LLGGRSHGNYSYHNNDDDNNKGGWNFGRWQCVYHLEANNVHILHECILYVLDKCNRTFTIVHFPLV
jgi:hypothetical protein